VADDVGVPAKGRCGLEKRTDRLLAGLLPCLDLPSEDRTRRDSEQRRRRLGGEGEHSADLEDAPPLVRRVVRAFLLRQLVEARAEDVGDVGEHPCDQTVLPAKGVGLHEGVGESRRSRRLWPRARESKRAAFWTALWAMALLNGRRRETRNKRSGQESEPSAVIGVLSSR
jgi:hypothetical protein